MLHERYPRNALGFSFGTEKQSGIQIVCQPQKKTSQIRKGWPVFFCGGPEKLTIASDSAPVTDTVNKKRTSPGMWALDCIWL